MMQSRIGVAVQGPDGVIHGFLNDRHEEELTDGGSRLEHVRSLEVPTDDLGTIAKGSVLVINTASWRVWTWPPIRKDDGLVSVVTIVPVAS